MYICTYVCIYIYIYYPSSVAIRRRLLSSVVRRPSSVVRWRRPSSVRQCNTYKVSSFIGWRCKGVGAYKGLAGSRLLQLVTNKLLSPEFPRLHCTSCPRQNDARLNFDSAEAPSGLKRPQSLIQQERKQLLEILRAHIKVHDLCVWCLFQAPAADMLLTFYWLFQLHIQKTSCCVATVFC